MKHNVNLFIVGAAKSGTTSLWRGFKSHPDIYVTEDELYKEPGFFSHYGERMGLDRYHSLFSGHTDEKYICDASTAYLTSPESAERVYQYNPHAKILIILRDPVARAYSLYNWMVADGYEWAGTFERALELEDGRLKKGVTSFLMPQYFWNYMYFHSGCYVSQIKRFQKYFTDNVLLLTLNEMVSSPDTFISRICDFLEIENTAINFTKENVSVDVYSPTLTFLARQITMFYHKFSPGQKVRSKYKQDLLVNLTRKKSMPAPIRRATREVLFARYEDELVEIENEYGLKLIS